MKKRELQELKSKPLPELQKLAKESRERLRELKFNLAAGKVKNVKELHALKRNIARISTFINEAARS
ncbi:MAG: 50S ribosomal protein L29 [Patescibacteria group bacterium]